MIRSICLSLAFACASPALAQQTGLSVPMPTPASGGYNTNFSVPFPYRDTITPTMRRQRAARIEALREKAVELLNANGGSLTEQQQSYFRSEVYAITTGRRRMVVGAVR